MIEQTTDVLELLAANDKATTAAELRAIAADSEQLGKSLANSVLQLGRPEGAPCTAAVGTRSSGPPTATTT
ncbi:hypothetical protein [Streptomyces sp. NRRL B-1347]|uniref:hypothetical protein n=1 Tax=Streptomyces sp. NRRL B-1347 TaxID=1476877 RepID=UPI0004CA02E6|nr:hypothetical protein [Streptomyces sp. NRRL B-1347]